jgi:hypothetical protein
LVPRLPAATAAAAAAASCRRSAHWTAERRLRLAGTCAPRGACAAASPAAPAARDTVPRRRAGACCWRRSRGRWRARCQSSRGGRRVSAGLVGGGDAECARRVRGRGGRRAHGGAAPPHSCESRGGSRAEAAAAARGHAARTLCLAARWCWLQVLRVRVRVSASVSVSVCRMHIRALVYVSAFLASSLSHGMPWKASSAQTARLRGGLDPLITLSVAPCPGL